MSHCVAALGRKKEKEKGKGNARELLSLPMSKVRGKRGFKNWLESNEGFKGPSISIVSHWKTHPVSNPLSRSGTTQSGPGSDYQLDGFVRSMPWHIPYLVVGLACICVICVHIAWSSPQIFFAVMV
jgi:hypothetical protein